MPAVSTPTFLRTIAFCWKRPRLLAIELLWRWLCGGFLLLVFGLEAQRIAAATAPAIQATGLLNASLESAIQDPTQISLAFAATIDILRPWITHAAIGLAPLALFSWVAAFAFGRAALLRQYDGTLPSRGWLLAICEGVRLLSLFALSAFWYIALKWSAAYALGPSSASAAPQGEPNLVLYCVLVLCISAALFSIWSLVSWALVAAPLVAMVERGGFRTGLARSFRAGRVRGKLIEINVAMAIIKLGLVVLAVVFSATPLPFQTSMNGSSLTAWWVFVSVVYLAASDFFKMAQLLTFLELWRDHLRSGRSALGAKDQDQVLRLRQENVTK